MADIENEVHFNLNPSFFDITSNSSYSSSDEDVLSYGDLLSSCDKISKQYVNLKQ